MCLSDRSTSTSALSDRSTFTSTDARATDLRHCFGGLAIVQACVCLQELKLSPPQSFHGIRAWYRLRAEQQAQEAKEAVRQQSSSLPASCSPLHPCRSSWGGASKRHRIEELSSPRRSYRDCIQSLDGILGLKLRFCIISTSVFESAGVRVLFGQDVR